MYGEGANYHPSSPARHQSSSSGTSPALPPCPIPLQISAAPFPLASPAGSNGWERQYDLQGDHLQYGADTLSDVGSTGKGNGKRKFFDQDEFAKQEEVRHFDQMINYSSEHCYKVIADYVDNAMTKVIFHQTKAETCHRELFKEGKTRVC